MSLVKRIMKTNSDWSPMIARLALGIMILPHGLQKTLGMFGGYGFTNTLNFFTQQMGVPWIFALLAILAESLGGLGLILGLYSRVAALGVGSVMAVAIFKVHWNVGFFMNWMGTQKGEGFEFHILAIGLALVVMLSGGGKFSLDRVASS